MVANAVTEGKIAEASATTWLDLAYTNFENASALIATIPSRVAAPAVLDIVASIKEPIADTNESPAIAFGKWEKANPSASVTDWKTAFKLYFKQDYDQMAGRK